MIDNFAPFFSRRYMRVNMQMYFFWPNQYLCFV
jgi:hypothetical protein